MRLGKTKSEPLVKFGEILKENESLKLKIKKEKTYCEILSRENTKYALEIKSIQEKLSEYHNAYEGKKHRIYELEEKLAVAREALKQIMGTSGINVSMPDGFPKSLPMIIYDEAKQALQQIGDDK